MSKHYIDIRLNVTFEEETYEQFGETYTERFISDMEPEVIGISNMETGELIGIAESLFDTDKYQIMLANDIPTSIYEYGEEHAE